MTAERLHARELPPLLPFLLARRKYDEQPRTCAPYEALRNACEDYGMTHAGPYANWLCKKLDAAMEAVREPATITGDEAPYVLAAYDYACAELAARHHRTGA